MGFKDYYLGEMSKVSLEGLSCPVNIVNNGDNLGEVPYCVNPSKNDYIRLLKDPLSEFKWGKESYHSVRIGITKDNKIYMFPGNIMHQAMSEGLGINFKYRLQYDPINYPYRYLTDTPTDYTQYFDKHYDEKMKALVILLMTNFDYIPAIAIYEWEDRKTSKPLVNFGYYVDIKNIKHNDIEIEEPEYSRIIRKFHESVRTSTKKEIDPEIKKIGDSLAKQISPELKFDGYIDDPDFPESFKKRWQFTDQKNKGTFWAEGNFRDVYNHFINARKRFGISVSN